MCQGEGADASGPSWLPGGAGHPAAVGGWRSSAADHQPGPELCLRPVSLTLRGGSDAGSGINQRHHIMAPVVFYF